LFPELKPILAEAFELAPEGAKYVVGGNYREGSLTDKGWKNCNLRTQFKRLIERAGLTTWPRLFHAMRASRETELAKDHPIHVVVGWMGNTISIAMRHYLQITDADFDRATKSAAESGAVALQKPVQQPHAPLRNEPQDTKQPLGTEGLVLAVATSCDTVQNDLVEAAGIEPASRNGSMRASTCVVDYLIFAHMDPCRPGSTHTSRERVLTTGVPNNDPRRFGIGDQHSGLSDKSPQSGLLISRQP